MKHHQQHTSIPSRLKKGMITTLLYSGASMAAILGATSIAPVAAEQGATQVIDFSIPGGALGEALQLFGKQSGLQVASSSNDVRGKKAGPISGNLTAAAALDLLLAESGLSYSFASDTMVVVKQSGTENGTGSADVDQGETFVLEEIIVTATKRATNLQETPVSITALTDRQMRQAGSQSLQDIASSIPNMTWPDAIVPTIADISIRGIYSYVGPQNIGFDAGFGVYLDGVFMGKQNAVNTGLAEVERVEVLRGPQGTLFGKNTIAGAINIISKKPGNEFEGKVEMDVGNLDLFRVKGSLNIPIVEDVLAARIAFGKTKRDGYITNLHNGDDDYGNIDQTSGRLQIAYTPSDTTRAYLSVDMLQAEGKFSYYEFLEDATYGDDEPYTIYENSPGEFKKDNLGASMTIEHDLAGGYAITSITGWRNDKAFRANDADASPLDAFATIAEKPEQHMFTQELRISSPADTWYDYVAGVYYFNQKNNAFYLNHFGQDFLGIKGPDWVGNDSYRNSVDVVSYAAFFHTNIHIGEKLTLFGGARYTDEKKEMKAFDETCDPIALCHNLGYSIGVEIPSPVDVKMSEPSWSVGLRYVWTDDLMTYASVSTGVKSGAFNLTHNPVQAFASQNLVADSEFMTNYEAGVKSTWLDGRLRLNMALFYMKYNDLQVSNYCSTCGSAATGAFILSNAASVTSKGFEVELYAQPTDTLSLNAGIGYVDSIYDKFEGLNDPRPISLGGQGIIDASGNRLANAPKWTINATATHELPLRNDATWVTRLDYNYTDEFYGAFRGALNTSDYLVPGYSLLNARIGYRSAGEEWSVYLWAKNLTDNHAPNRRQFTNFPAGVVFGATQQYIQPRTYGVSLNYSF